MKGKINMEKAKANLKAYARREISKRELVQFRIDSSNMEELLAEAEKEKLPLGTMIRDWVLERLAERREVEIPNAQPMQQMPAAEILVTQETPVPVPYPATKEHASSVKEAWKHAFGRPEFQEKIIEALMTVNADQFLQIEPERSPKASARSDKAISKSKKKR